MFLYELQYREDNVWMVWDTYFSYHMAELEASEFNGSVNWKIRKVRVSTSNYMDLVA